MDSLPTRLTYPDLGRDGRVFESRHPAKKEKAIFTKMASFIFGCKFLLAIHSNQKLLVGFGAFHLLDKKVHGLFAGHIGNVVS